MPKLGEEELAKELQKAWDEASMSSSAYFAYERALNAAIRKVMDRCIAQHEEMSESVDLEPHEFLYRHATYSPTKEEANHILELHKNVLLFKDISEEKRARWSYIDRKRKPMPIGYIKFKEEKDNLRELIYLAIYKYTVFIAALIIIWRAL